MIELILIMDVFMPQILVYKIADFFCDVLRKENSNQK